MLVHCGSLDEMTSIERTLTILLRLLQQWQKQQYPKLKLNMSWCCYSLELIFYQKIESMKEDHKKLKVEDAQQVLRLFETIQELEVSEWWLKNAVQ